MREDYKVRPDKIGKSSWHKLLHHVATLHEESTHTPCYGLPYQWEETAPSRELGIQFGHWETIHICLDLLPYSPKHGLRQVLNCLALQEENGLIPSQFTITGSEIKWTTKSTSPPLWPMALNNYLLENIDLMAGCYEHLIKQIQWFESERRGGRGGFVYLDFFDHFWESGIEDGVRYQYDGEMSDENACIDATSHVYSLYKHASKWADLLGREAKEWKIKAFELQMFIQEELYHPERGFFFDHWSVKDRHHQKITFEGFWPIIVGAATKEQADRMINDYLLSPHHFLTKHPIPSVSISDPHFAPIHWQGASYNSLVYWAVHGCIHYNRPDAAAMLLEKCLDATTEIFRQTGQIWESYHPNMKHPEEIERPLVGHPCKDHLGHNPLIALATTYELLKS